jgi:hypothetical protein
MPDDNERVPCSILGKDIGTMSGWDIVDTFAEIFYGFEPNELGKKFLRSGPDKCNLVVNFESGQVSSNFIEDEEEVTLEHTVDWGVFNEPQNGGEIEDETK